MASNNTINLAFSSLFDSEVTNSELTAGVALATCMLGDLNFEVKILGTAKTHKRKFRFRV